MPDMWDSLLENKAAGPGRRLPLSFTVDRALRLARKSLTAAGPWVAGARRGYPGLLSGPLLSRSVVSMKQAVKALGEAVSLLTLAGGHEVGSRDEIKEWVRDLAAAEAEVASIEDLLAWHAREVGADMPLSPGIGVRIGETFDSLLDLYRKTGIGEQEGLAPTLPLSTAPMVHGR